VAGGARDVVELAGRHPERVAHWSRRRSAAHDRGAAYARGSLFEGARVNILLLLIPLSLLFLAGAVWLFFWAVNHGQFDDLDTPALLPLDEPPRDEDPPP
jgi:cbb3-type cytochrome oxidase maturation protein